ncbi:BCCT family transporter [Agrococcus jejuensis]|uniref:Choline/glycine/proline betaine transport protein n=1 Tax=Agrococcus jejuensis TaxID=399736 RepID=A0A1G8DTF8_9MICO|nr:BCCT family transporter [Agrococcus jejuensis]SDH60984.1 choline/glycine/proline betaine transport protein [Agrococcus jejuensis]
MPEPMSRLRADWSPAVVWRGLNKPVFIPAVVLVFGLVIFAIVYGQTGGDAFAQLNAIITEGVGWWYVLAATGFVVFALYCGLSRIGQIKLGRDDEEPEFSTLSWFTMLFSAGMGIGLVFYGVAEPLSHMMTPPVGAGVEPGTGEAGRTAMDLTLFHWGLHAWAIYVVVGLGLAYMTFRRGRPLSIRWLLEPLIGRTRTEGWIGHAVDVVAIVGTLFGVATSLGFGVQQITAGLEFLGWIEGTPTFTIVAIAVITGMATLSVVSGLDKGLKWLSNVNMSLAALLAVFVLLLGPTLVILQAIVANTGSYVASLPGQMLETFPLANDSWSGDWTIFYWGWWMSWAPFVGMFIARISRGRTIRQFVMGVLLAPTAIGILWFTIFGDSAIIRQLAEGDMLVDGAVDTNTSLFHLLDTLPLSTITSVLAILVIVFFFVTSSDSGSLVIDILSTGGDTETPRLTRVFWSVTEGIAAAALLLVGGSASLTALQTTSIATAVPFSIIMALACISLLRAFHYEVASTPRYVRARIASGGDVGSAVAEAVGAAEGGGRSTGWRRGIRDFSATFAGLSKSSPQPSTQQETGEGEFLVALHTVPSEAVDVDARTGVATYDEDRAVQDPIAGEVFDTPEFAASHAGHLLEMEGESKPREEDAAKDEER